MNINIFKILETVLEETKVTEEQVKLKNKEKGARKQEYVEARRIFGVLARKYTKHSFSRIGSFICKDHSTVIAYTKKHSDLYFSDPIYKNLTDEIENKLKLSTE